MTILLAFFPAQYADTLATLLGQVIPGCTTRAADSPEAVHQLLQQQHISLLVWHLEPQKPAPAETLFRKILDPTPTNGANGKEGGAIGGVACLPPILFATARDRDHLDAVDDGAAPLPVPPADAELVARLQQLFPELFDHLQVQCKGGVTIRVRMAEIDAVLADEGGSVLLVGGREWKARHTFRTWSQLASRSGFAQLDRCTLVRLGAIRVVIPHGRGACLHFRSGSLTIGRTAFATLRHNMAALPERHHGSNGAHGSNDHAHGADGSSYPEVTPETEESAKEYP